MLWFEKRTPHEHWAAQPALPRTVNGVELKQRAKDEEVPKQQDRQEDNVYHMFEVNKICAEMPRPNLVAADIPWGGFTLERLRIAALYRHILERTNYLHVCTPNYCMKGRSTCRFFYPFGTQFA